MKSIAPTNEFQVFPALKQGSIDPMPMSVGYWISTSGAAFTTGLGAQTSTALSFLCTFLNIRLGCWWYSGARPEDRDHYAPHFPSKAYFTRLLTRMFSVQGHLLDELLGRFHGPNTRATWYLSDGGHFENSACYELIRRRLPLIICLDNGEDQEANFTDVANLIRKARLDFGVEIEFLNSSELSVELDSSVRKAFGSLEDLRRNSEGRSSAYAALARLRSEGTTFGRLVLIKPGLIGNESLDVEQYQRIHADFPQETTVDQFFDEAQWESYRMLGETIGAQVFAEPEDSSKWCPAIMRSS